MRVGLCRVVQIVDDEPDHGRVRPLRLAPDTPTSGDSESAERVCPTGSPSIDRRQVTPSGSRRSKRGPSENPVPLLTWTFWSGRPDLNRRPLDPQARMRCLGWSEGVERRARHLQKHPGRAARIDGSLNALAPVIGSLNPMATPLIASGSYLLSKTLGLASAAVTALPRMDPISTCSRAIIYPSSSEQRPSVPSPAVCHTENSGIWLNERGETP